MKILAVETSGYEGSVALADGLILTEQRFLTAEGRRPAQTLVSEVAELLKAHSVKPGGIDAVAVSIGPGSFTGLRVGVVFAKTFAWANNAELIAVDTLRAAAQQIDGASASVAVISDAQRDEVFLNAYLWDADAGCRFATGETTIIPIEEVAAKTADCQTITGPGLKKFASHFASDRLAQESLRLPKAADVATLGSIMLARGETADVRQLEPVYIRRSYAEEKRPAK